MIRPVPQVAAMAPYALADPLPEGWVSLAQNESAFAPSPRAVAAGAGALAGAAAYPDPDWGDLVDAVRGAYPVAGGTILCGAGSMALIGALIRAFAGPGDRVLGTAFGYLFVATACAQAGAAYDTVPEPDFTVSVDFLRAAVRSETRIVFVCNPGNPTGTRIPNAEILRLRAGLPAGVLLAVDQAYGEFDGQDPGAVFDLLDRGDTVVFRTLSKAYGLAGARVGWGAFPDAVAREVRKVMEPNNLSLASQAAGAAALRDPGHMRRVVTETAEVRERFRAQLLAAGYAIPESHTNFVLIPFADVDAAAAADARLRKAGILVRGMEGYGLPHCLRATIGTAEVMAQVAAILTGGEVAR